MRAAWPGRRPDGGEWGPGEFRSGNSVIATALRRNACPTRETASSETREDCLSQGPTPRQPDTDLRADLGGERELVLGHLAELGAACLVGHVAEHVFAERVIFLHEVEAHVVEMLEVEPTILAQGRGDVVSAAGEGAEQPQRVVAVAGGGLRVEPPVRELERRERVAVLVARAVALARANR